MASNNKSLRPFIYGAIFGTGIGLIVSSFLHQTYANLGVLGHLVGLALLPVGAGLMIRANRSQPTE